MKLLYILTIIPLLLLTNCNEANNDIKGETSVEIHDEVLAEIDARMFGQFLEKPSWVGETGPEAALIPGTHDLQEGVFELMEDLHIPVIRFPGGRDVNIQDWTTMIDNAPGRDEAGRPLFIGSEGDTVTNNFGYDEMFQLAEDLNSEVMLVTNFGDAYFEKMSLEDAVLHEAGLLAYANLEVGADLPEGMPDWPAIREKNGRAEPYNIKYVQIANEPWVMDRELRMQGEIDADIKEHYLHVLEAFIEGFKEIDPDIKIIADGNSEDITRPLPERFGDQIDYLSYHIYKPHRISEVLINGEEVHAEELTIDEIWKGWVSVPQFNYQGESVIDNEIYHTAKSTGYPIAVTEWNWNGWWETEPEENRPDVSHFIQGVGVAGFIHGLMREGNDIKIGNQSMLIGNSWGITGIRVSPEMEFEPYLWPSGQVAGFYSEFHGNELLEISTHNIPTYEQPYTFNRIEPIEKVSYLDVMATRSDENIYLHIINRHFDDDIELHVNADQISINDQTAIHRIFEGTLDNSPCKEGSLQMGCFRTNEVEWNSESNSVTIPKRSVSIVEFNR